MNDRPSLRYAVALGLALVFASSACDEKKKKRSDETEEEEEDDRPRKKKSESSKSAAASSSATASAAPTAGIFPDLDAKPPPALAGYSVYKNAAGAYEILMPCTPTEEQSTLKGGSTQHQSTCNSGGKEQAVMWQVLPAAGTMGALENARDASHQFLDNVTYKAVKVGPYDGFDVSGSPKNASGTMHIRMVMVKDRFYQMLDLGLSEAESLAWRGSFKLAGEPGAAGAASAGSLAKTCETYLAKLEKCNENAIASVPEGSAKEEVRKSMADALKKTREAWSGMPGAALETACQSALDALASNPSCK